MHMQAKVRGRREMLSNEAVLAQAAHPSLPEEPALTLGKCLFVSNRGKQALACRHNPMARCRKL